MSTSLYWSIFVDSIPIMIGTTFETIVLTINIHYCTDTSMMAGLGLATVLVHCMGGACLYGFNAGYTNFASRAFGAKNRRKFDQYMVQGLTNLLLLLVLFSLLGFTSYRLAKATGQSEAIALFSYKSYVYMLPGLCCFYTSDFIRNNLNCQLIFKPILYVFGTCGVLHLLLSWTISNSYGFSGIMVSTNITFACLLCLTLLVQHKYGTWRLSMDSFKIENPYHEYKQFAKECFYVAMPFCLDLFMYEFMTLYLGSFRILQQMAAHVAISNICNIMISPYLGYSICCMTKIGNYIGQNKPIEIKQLIKAATILALISIYILQILLLIFEDTIVNFYTSEVEVHKYMFRIFRLWILLYFVDSIQFIASHVFKALGMGSWVMKNFFISFYCIAFVCMVMFSRMMDEKITAIWSGFLVGSVVLTSTFVYKYLHLDIQGTTFDLYSKVKTDEPLSFELIAKD